MVTAISITLHVSIYFTNNTITGKNNDNETLKTTMNSGHS